MDKSGYVLAGFDTFATIVNNFMLGKKGDWNDNFTRERVADFLRETCAGFLHSYGQSFTGKKRYEKYNEKEARLYKKCRDLGFFDGCDFIADSGGFQISVGRMTESEAHLLQDLYYQFVQDYKHLIDKAFILDVPPGPGCKIFKDFKDVYDHNLKSYKVAKNLPDDVRDKIIYIHHFRTPRLWDIYTKIMRENDMFSAFQYHGTGGIVANLVSDMVIPCIIYVLPLVPLLVEAKKAGRDFLNFHILGGANFRDVMYYELFKIVVKEYHGIDLKITYDSSGLFKSFMIGRYLWIRHPDGHLKKMDVRTPNLNRRFSHDTFVRDQYQITMDEFADKVGFKRIDLKDIYNPDTGTFYEDIKVYSMFYMLHQWREVQNEMKAWAKEIYPLYKNKQRDMFTNACMEATRDLNSRRITQKGLTKGRSIIRSLDMLIELNEPYCKYIVDKVLSKDEFIQLDERTRILPA